MKACNALWLFMASLMAESCRYSVFVLEASTSNRLTYFIPPLVSFMSFYSAEAMPFVLRPRRAVLRSSTAGMSCCIELASGGREQDQHAQPITLQLPSVGRQSLFTGPPLDVEVQWGGATNTLSRRSGLCPVPLLIYNTNTLLFAGGRHACSLGAVIEARADRFR